MRKHTLPCCFFLSCFALSTQAVEDVLSSDGRMVRLHDDGRWEYLSEDRYATTADGEQVRLKPDGSWEVTDEPVAQRAPPVLPASAALPGSEVKVELQDVVIETVRGKKSGAQKTASMKTRTLFYLSFSLPAAAQSPASLAIAATDFALIDSAGREYTILSAAPADLTLQPGQETTITVAADGSPHWFTTKFYELTIRGALSGSDKDVALKRNLSGVKKVQVDKFSA